VERVVSRLAVQRRDVREVDRVPQRGVAVWVVTSVFR
jgi:hypothetical protein